MNVPRFPVANEAQDPFRPTEARWGPLRIYQSGVLADAARFPDGRGIARPAGCPICRGEAPRGIAVVYGYPVYECPECGAGFVWPQPPTEALRDYYGPGYWINYSGDSRPLYERPALRDHVLRRQAELLHGLLGRDTAARILDVGSGDGSMLRSLLDLGYRNLVGLDVDPQNTRRAEGLWGVKVLCQDFLSFRESAWDAITFWAVVEHLRDPVAVVSHARRLLARGGVVVVMTGDNDSLCARLQRCFDMWMYPPEHLFFFGSRALRRLLGAGGLVSVRCRLGFQSVVKERALWLVRVAQAVRARRRGAGRPRWRSVNSNLLVAWGRRGA